MFPAITSAMSSRARPPPKVERVDQRHIEPTRAPDFIAGTPPGVLKCCRRQRRVFGRLHACGRNASSVSVAVRTIEKRKLFRHLTISANRPALRHTAMLTAADRTRPPGPSSAIIAVASSPSRP